MLVRGTIYWSKQSRTLPFVLKSMCNWIDTISPLDETISKHKTLHIVHVLSKRQPSSTRSEEANLPAIPWIPPFNYPGRRQRKPSDAFDNPINSRGQMCRFLVLLSGSYSIPSVCPFSFWSKTKTFSNYSKPPSSRPPPGVCHSRPKPCFLRP